MKNFTAFITLMLLGVGFLSAQTSLEGKVVDAETNEPIIFGNVALYKNGVLITGTETDFDGNYAFSNIDPGTYDVEATYVGYQAQRQVGVVVLAGKAVKLDFSLSSGVLLTEVEVIDYEVPLIEQDNTTTGGVVTAEKIRNLPTKSINALAATTAGLSSIDGGDISIRGSRTNATDYYIDGVRVSGNLIPQSEIDQLQVITGGIEAQYGDVTGGIISITTKGPSSRFAGGIELETSEFLDPYGYNLISGNFSGPLLRNSEGRSILGFRVSGQFLNRKDDGPSAFGRYRATEEIIDQLEANPLRVVSGSTLNSAEFISDSDVILQEARPNSENTQFDITAKLDARLSDQIDITFSGNYNNVENIFSPSEAWALFNWRNNPVNMNSRYRGNIRFRHRLGGSPVLDPAARSAEAKSSLIRNAQYTLQFGYQKGFSETMDIRHQDNLFDYGYVGNFDNEWIPAVGESPYSGATPRGNIFVAHAGYTQIFNGWTPGTQNPVRARYNDLQEGVPAMTQFNAYNGFLSGNFGSTWSGLHTNVGAIYNSYAMSEGDRYTFSATSSFDLFPGGSNKGRHNIQFGIIYEQRIGRSWAIGPNRLWEIARLQANAQIIGIDTNTIIGTFNDTLFNGTVETFDQFQTLVNDDSDLLFFRKVRELTGQSIYEYVNVDGIDPSLLSLDMFSAQELNDQRILNYYGYDYLGNLISSDATFDDFFSDFDEEGRRQFTVAPNKPIYTAAYIQDKFTFRDIIFRLGLRVDRYDANTKVLKDPFTLYPIMTAGDFFDGPGIGEQVPPNVEDDWKIYVETEGSTTVRAFRDGEQWYDAEGSPVNDGNVIFGGELVNPYYIEQDNTRRNIRSRDFDPSGTFEDYTPQISWMPRMAFSFPISDEANFFAHYDILVQRPPTSTLATALDYYY
ncbi:MAG: carboxypeptidase regulatory-like domain-containing protein, partial [Saprospiraceae bacterium]|nr:carboxypeptidase regulatory-like domain-containing protein [Saprospiraceae bacterium]